jgi:hypothetical protein
MMKSSVLAAAMATALSQVGFVVAAGCAGGKPFGPYETAGRSSFYLVLSEALPKSEKQQEVAQVWNPVIGKRGDNRRVECVDDNKLKVFKGAEGTDADLQPKEDGQAKEAARSISIQTLDCENNEKLELKSSLPEPEKGTTIEFSKQFGDWNKVASVSKKEDKATKSTGHKFKIVSDAEGQVTIEFGGETPADKVTGCKVPKAGGCGVCCWVCIVGGCVAGVVAVVVLIVLLRGSSGNVEDDDEEEELTSGDDK